MQFITPTESESVAWEGELIEPSGTLEAVGPTPIVASLGRPEFWPAAAALEVVGKPWTPPLGGAEFWLLRLACTLHEPEGHRSLVSAQERLFLRPRNPATGEGTAYAYSLFPERLGVEDKAVINASLGPELTLSNVGLKVGQVGASIELRKVFPVIQAYGAGQPAPWWEFKAHGAYPLAGCQFVYAVVAALAGAGGIRAAVELVVTVESRLGGLVRLGLPEEAHVHLRFNIP